MDKSRKETIERLYKITQPITPKFEINSTFGQFPKKTQEVFSLIKLILVYRTILHG